MYLHRHDESGRLAVWLFDKSSSKEWDEHFEHLKALSGWSAKGGPRAAAVLIAGSFARPDSHHRVELARLTEAPGYDPYVAFVMPNLAVRSVLTMMGWVQKAPKYEMSFVASTADALTWLDTRRRDARIGLQAMIDAVLEEQRQVTSA